MTASLHIPGYKIERMLAKGGMAEVFLAEQLSLGRRVAIKVVDASTSDPEFAERFLHEARLVAALNHANLITIYDFGQLDNGKLFLIMEYLQGGDLEERLRHGIPEKPAVQILRSLASVLQFVHGQGIIHRDIKPANILFRQDGTLVLTDFGIAKTINNDVGVTQAGVIVGSAAYGSPEQMQGLELDIRSDIYSLGVLFLEMLTGKNPFMAASFVNTAMNHIQLEIPRLAAHVSHFQPLIDKMLAKHVVDRYASAADLLAVLDGIAPVTGSHPVASFSHPSLVVTRTNPAITTEKIEALTPASPAKALDTKPLSKTLLDDEFLEEAKLLLASDGLPAASMPESNRKPLASSPTQTPKRQTNDTQYRGYEGGARTRPLPSNLLDDD
jgi:serine/threonine protein kinase